jgi:adenosine deaminase
VCPTSNVLLSVVPSMQEHPLPKLLDAGVGCSVNVDDPLLFETTLVSEYERCRDTLGLSDAQPAWIAWRSLEASSAPPELTQRAYQGIERWLTHGYQ